MLPKAHRLRTDREYSQVYRAGRRFSNSYFTLYRLKVVEGTLRLGIVTSKKVGIAVIRNRLRRQVREVFRKLWPSLTPGYSLVVVVQAAAVGLTYQAVTSQVQLLLERAEVLGGDSGRSVI